MNKELAYRLQMLPASIRNSRSLAALELSKCGWPQTVLERDIDSAMAWARSHCLTIQQERMRKNREKKKTKIKGDDALDLMFASVGADPTTISRK